MSKKKCKLKHKGDDDPRPPHPESVYRSLVFKADMLHHQLEATPNDAFVAAELERVVRAIEQTKLRMKAYASLHPLRKLAREHPHKRAEGSLTYLCQYLSALEEADLWGTMVREADREIQHISILIQQAPEDKRAEVAAAYKPSLDELVMRHNMGLDVIKRRG